jgi:sulfide:quinone oxidoreductase
MAGTLAPAGVYLGFVAENRSDTRPRILIAGGGVAGLEAALALHHLAPGLADVTLLAPDPEFVVKPLAVNEPFSLQPAERHELGPAMHELGFDFVLDGITSVEPGAHQVELASGERLGYDLLICAIGGRARPVYESAETFWASHSDLAVNEQLDAAASSPGATLSFIVPPGCSWPLPIYELALMARNRADERAPRELGMAVITPEESPLAIFGQAASAAVVELLRARAIDVITGTSVVEEGGALRTVPAGHSLPDGPAIALPAIEGPGLRGLPADEDGFVPIDLHARVRGIQDVYAAGDGTSFPIKQGGIATQEADAAAEHIAARLGAEVEPRPFEPVLRGQLIAGSESLNLRHGLGGGHGEGGASLDYLWWPPGKIAGRYLAPWLLGTDPGESLDPPGRPLDVEVSLPHEWHGDPMAMGTHPAPPP